MGFIWNLILEIDFTPFNSNLIYLILRLALGYHVVLRWGINLKLKVEIEIES